MIWLELAWGGVHARHVSFSTVLLSGGFRDGPVEVAGDHHDSRRLPGLTVALAQAARPRPKGMNDAI